MNDSRFRKTISLLPVSPELEKLFIVAENWKKNLGKTRRCC